MCVDCRVGGEWMVQGWWLGTVSDGTIVVGGWEGLDYSAYATLIPQLQWFFSRMSVRMWMVWRVVTGHSN